MAIPCNTMQYHADGAYHCPVGSILPFLSPLVSSFLFRAWAAHRHIIVPILYILMGWWESQPKNQIFFILKITQDWWKYCWSVGKRFPDLFSFICYYWCKIPPQSLIFPYCALNQRNPLGGLASIKGEINLPLDWLTVQKAKLTWQSELDDSLSGTSESGFLKFEKCKVKTKCFHPFSGSAKWK